MSNSSYATHDFHVKTYGADFTYQEFAPLFTVRDEWRLPSPYISSILTHRALAPYLPIHSRLLHQTSLLTLSWLHTQASLFQPDEWANLFKASGAKYVVLTSKHHGQNRRTKVLNSFFFANVWGSEGYTLWKSAQSWNWNSVDVGPEIDIVQVRIDSMRLIHISSLMLCLTSQTLSDSIRAVGLEFGLYYSLYEWFNPIYLQTPKTYISEIMIPQMYDIINTYKPSILWGDGCDDYTSDYWYESIISETLI